MNIFTLSRRAKSLVLPSVIALCASVASVSASSDALEWRPVGFVQDTGAADRVLYGDRLRTLTQVMASAACHLKAEIDFEANKKLLRQGIDEFDLILNALEMGNPDLHILTEETDLKVLRKLAIVRGKWEVLKPAYATIKTDPMNDAARATIYEKTDKLLSSTALLLVQIEAEHSNPVELLQSDALLLEIVGRQAMVSQRLSYEACKVWSGIGKQKDVEELYELTGLFQNAITALLDGNDALGLKPAPTEEIRTGLTKVISDWDKISWKLRTLAENGTITPEEAQYLCRKLFGKMTRLEKITHLYADYSRRVY